MRLIRPMLSVAGVALCGNAAALLAFEFYLALELKRFVSPHAARGTGGFPFPPAKLPAAAP